jgi:hypothetical protein
MKWASWLNVLLGAWLFVAPWVIGYSGTGALDDHAAGLTVLLVALASVAVPLNVDTLAIVNLLAGIWIAASPIMFGYGDLRAAASNDVGVGLLIVLMAAIRIGSSRRMPGQRVMD